MYNFEELLDQSITLMNTEGLSLEERLDLFIESDGEDLRPFLETMYSVKKVYIPEPIEKEDNKSQFLRLVAETAQAEKATEPALSKGTRHRFGSWLRKTAAAVTVVVTLTGGVAAAAAGSAPGSFLYPIKKAVQAAPLALPQSDFSRAERHLDLARVRLDELAGVVDVDSAFVGELRADIYHNLRLAKKIGKRLTGHQQRLILDRYATLRLEANELSRGKDSSSTERGLDEASDSNAQNDAEDIDAGKEAAQSEEDDQDGEDEVESLTERGEDKEYDSDAPQTIQDANELQGQSDDHDVGDQSESESDDSDDAVDINTGESEAGGDQGD